MAQDQYGPGTVDYYGSIRSQLAQTPSYDTRPQAVGTAPGNMTRWSDGSVGYERPGVDNVAFRNSIESNYAAAQIARDMRQATAQENSDFRALGEANFYNKMRPTYDAQAEQNANNKLKYDNLSAAQNASNRLKYDLPYANLMAEQTADNKLKYDMQYRDTMALGSTARAEQEAEDRALALQKYRTMMGVDPMGKGTEPTNKVTTKVQGTGGYYIPGQYATRA